MASIKPTVYSIKARLKKCLLFIWNVNFFYTCTVNRSIEYGLVLDRPHMEIGPLPIDIHEKASIQPRHFTFANKQKNNYDILLLIVLIRSYKNNSASRFLTRKWICLQKRLLYHSNIKNCPKWILLLRHLY